MAAVGFGAVSDPPMRAFPAIALLAAMGHALRFCLMDTGVDIASASLCASVAIGIGSLLLGGRIHCPMTVLFIPALLPMIPGMYAYKTVFSMIMFMQNLDDPSAAGYLAAIVRNGFVTFSVIFMLAAGAAAPIFLFNKRAHSLTRNKNRFAADYGTLLANYRRLQYDDLARAGAHRAGGRRPDGASLSAPDSPGENRNEMFSGVSQCVDHRRLLPRVVRCAGLQRSHGVFWGVMAAVWIYDAVVGYTTFERTYKHDKFAFALYLMPFLYPLISHLRGLDFPMTTSPVMPCTVAIFTIGLMLSFSKRINLFVVLFLCHWSLIGFSKVYFFGIPEDLLWRARWCRRSISFQGVYRRQFPPQRQTRSAGDEYAASGDVFGTRRLFRRDHLAAARRNGRIMPAARTSSPDRG